MARAAINEIKAKDSVNAAAAEEVAEDASELREDVVHIHASLAVGTIHAGHAELVIAGTFFRVGEDLISLIYLLEFFNI